LPVLLPVRHSIESPACPWFAAQPRPPRIAMLRAVLRSIQVLLWCIVGILTQNPSPRQRSAGRLPLQPSHLEGRRWRRGVDPDGPGRSTLDRHGGAGDLEGHQDQGVLIAISSSNPTAHTQKDRCDKQNANSRRAAHRPGAKRRVPSHDAATAIRRRGRAKVVHVRVDVAGALLVVGTQGPSLRVREDNDAFVLAVVKRR